MYSKPPLFAPTPYWVLLFSCPGISAPSWKSSSTSRPLYTLRSFPKNYLTSLWLPILCMRSAKYDTSIFGMASKCQPLRTFMTLLKSLISFPFPLNCKFLSACTTVYLYKCLRPRGLSIKNCGSNLITGYLFGFFFSYFLSSSSLGFSSGSSKSESCTL